MAQARVADPQTGLPVGAEIDATPASEPGPVVLRGRFGRVEKLDPERHATDLWQAFSGDDTLWPYMSYGPFPDQVAFRAWVEERTALRDPCSYAIVDADGRAVGVATLMEIRPAMRVIEVGHIVYSRALQKTPLATEAQYLLARYAFEELRYRRYEWKCNALNAPSRRAAERYGFTFEGIFRQHMIVKGRTRDTAWYAMLDGEWPARRRAFERWLAPANFDPAGRQHMSLRALNAQRIEEGDPGAPLRRAAPADAARLAAFQHTAYARNRSIMGVEPLPLTVDYGEVLDSYEGWLIEADELLGALVLDPQPDHLLVWSVASAPALHGRGIGKRLLAAAEARARALGLATLRLYTSEKMTQNVRWYHRHGYVIERVEEQADRRLVHMVKVLS